MHTLVLTSNQSVYQIEMSRFAHAKDMTRDQNSEMCQCLSLEA